MNDAKRDRVDDKMPVRDVVRPQGNAEMNDRDHSACKCPQNVNARIVVAAIGRFHEFCLLCVDTREYAVLRGRNKLATARIVNGHSATPSPLTTFQFPLGAHEHRQYPRRLPQHHMMDAQSPATHASPQD
jgi:hypothetical protein